MRKQAIHYRPKPIKVGAVAVGHRQDGSILVARAANQNLQPGDNPTKKCAEQKVIKELQDRGVYRIDALVVSGSPQPDTQSKFEVPTLHSCGNCRQCMVCAPEIDGQTIVLHVDPFLYGHEVYGVDELLATHAAPDSVDDFRYVVDPGFRTMQQGAVDYGFCIANGLLVPGELSPPEAFRQAVMGHLAVEEYQMAA